MYFLCEAHYSLLAVEHLGTLDGSTLSPHLGAILNSNITTKKIQKGEKHDT